MKKLGMACVLQSILAMTAFSATAWAQTYPSKPIRFIVGYTPGGAADILARAVGARINEAWGQQVIVDNRPGAGGAIGTVLVAKAAPDGLTMVLAAPSHSVIALINTPPPYDPIKDFAPITNMVNYPLLLVTHPSVPVKNVRELVALAKAKPDQLSYASPGSGNSGHLAGELFNSMAGVQTVHIPYKGQGPALTDLLSGQVSMLYSSIPSVIQQVKSGQLRALAVGSAKRLPSLPDIPTLAESGVPGYEAYSWVGLVAPAHTPADIVKKIHRDVSEILKDKEVAEKLNQQGALPVGDTPEEFGLYIKNEIAKWGKVVRDANIKAD